MVRDIDFGVEIVGSEIMRDSDGLASSSRNVHLSPEEREKALSISRSLLKAKSADEEGQVKCRELKDLAVHTITQAGGRIDYAETWRIWRQWKRSRFLLCSALLPGLVRLG